IGETVGATLIGGASLTPTIEVGQSELMSLSLNTGADFSSEDALWLRIESTGEAAWVDNVMVTIDGTNWSQLEVPEFAQAIGDEDYAANTTVAFNGIVAKYVKITANSNWGDGGFFDQYGLSEVRFTAIPVSAKEPNPEIGVTGVAVDTILDWRTGREATEHNVYLSTDQQAVIDGTAPLMTLSQTSYSPGFALSSTYFWRVDEVNNAEIPAIWPGDVWNFSTQEYLIVDDFESYNDIPVGQEGSYTVYSIWLDGYANPTVPPTNGSTMGYLIGTSLEMDNVHGGNKSVPLIYDNTTASISEVTANTNDLPCGSDWSYSSPQAFVLWLRGDPDNNSATDILYVKIGNSEEVIYDGDISIPQWKQWSIDLTTLGVNLNNVPTITIGLKRAGGIGGKGVVLLDDIMLYGIAPVVVVQPDPAENLTVNPSFESPDLGPGGTDQWADYVDDWIINTQGSCYLEDGTWEIVAPNGVATLKMWNGAAIWQQIGNVSPNTEYEISMFIGRGVETSAVQVELWAGGDPSALPVSYGIIGETVGATLIGGASLTPTIEVGQSELMGLSLNTGGDFSSEDALWIRIESIGGDGSAAWVDNVMVTVPAENLTVNPSFESPDLGPGGTGQWADNVDDWIINAQGNCYLEDGTWEIVAPDGVATLKMWSGAAIWQQTGNVNPNTDYEISMFIGRGVDTSAVQVELWAGGDPSALPDSFGVIGDTVGATLIGGAPLAPTVAVGENEWMSMVLNTGGGFTSGDALWLRIESTGEAAWIDNVMVTIP
ncbi:MAG: carbohydrate binding domain-containing protein, partial [Planctomycetota bacterium]